MKTTRTVLPAVLIALLTIPAIGRPGVDDTAKVDVSTPDMANMMGKPTVDVTVEELHLKVWLMTKEEYKGVMIGETDEPAARDVTGNDVVKMEMRGMTDTSMGMGKDTKGERYPGPGPYRAMMDSMKASTHHIGVDVTDIARGKEVAGASTRLTIVTPSLNSSTIDLNRMESEFDSPLTLKEKGEYRFTVIVSVGGTPKSAHFRYTVK